jgi:uncharacterized membrane protein
MTSIGAEVGVSTSHVGAHAAARTRLQSIDALRGVVMLFMLVDHVREVFYAHYAVTDPMNALTIEPALFFTRITSQICAPVFVFLTGLSAWLYGQSHSKRKPPSSCSSGAPSCSCSSSASWASPGRPRPSRRPSGCR